MELKAVLVPLVIAVVGRILSTEYEVGTVSIARHLVRRASKRLPPENRAAYEAEWLQVLEDIKSPTGRLLNAISILARAGKVAALLAQTSDFASSQTSMVIGYESMKRVIDFIGAITLLVGFLPILLIVSLTLRRTGSVLVHQLHVGRNGRKFRTFKFRCDGRLGRFLKDTSLDKLPAVLNVIKGDMSLVGPRARREDELQADDQVAHSYITVRPGLSGLAQTSKRYEGNSEADYDEAYIKSRSVTSDIVILFRTVQILLRRGPKSGSDRIDGKSE